MLALPAICVFCRALRVHAICIWVHLPQSDSGRCCCLSHLGPGPGVLFTFVRPGPVLMIPHRWVGRLASSCPPRAEPALGGSGCDCDGSHTVKSLSRPSHPIPSSPSPLVVVVVCCLPRHSVCPLLLLPSSCSLVLVPISIPHPSIHYPFGPSFRTAGRPHSHSHSHSRSCSDPPTPHPPHGVLGLTPPVSSLLVPISLFSSLSSLVCPGGLGLLWSGPVRSGFALPFLPCRALALPWLGFCPGPALPCLGVVWL